MKNKKLFAVITLICFALTMMPVAAFAAEPGPIDPQMSALVLADDQDDNVKVGAPVALDFQLRDAAGTTPAAAGFVYVWATEEGVSGRTAAMTVTGAGMGESTDMTGVYKAAAAEKMSIVATFARAGKFTIHAGYTKAEVTAFANIVELSGAAAEVVTVTGNAVNPDKYNIKVNDGEAAEKDAKYDWKLTNVTPNNVAKSYTVTITDKDGKPVSGKAITIEAGSANITVDQKANTTNFLGQVKFDMSAAREGKYNIYVSISGKQFILNVECGYTSAAYINVAKELTAPTAMFYGLDAQTPDIMFSITDINGNTVKAADKGMTKLGAEGATTVTGNDKYFFFVEKPKASALANSDLTLTYTEAKGGWVLTTANVFDAEGTYTAKIILDNGSYATTTWTVKAFQTPVKLMLLSANSTVELGGAINISMKYMDANGVMKPADDATMAANGYATANCEPLSANVYTITAKSDEKYVGATIELTAVSERYNLVGTKTLTVADGATAIAFANTKLDVNVNNTVAWNIVDSQGNKVSLGAGLKATDISYVVLDKPEGAKVSVYDKTIPADLNSKGLGAMAITSNKVGNVTVQAIVRATYNKDSKAETEQIKYYTGTQIFAVGTEGTGKVVVMSVGSNEIVKDNAKATIDAAPMVQNSRTFVPFRALAEAFGATVAYDEATQSVTAELNGTTVVMTIGAATYTVNGVEAAMDVAPFISASRTYVPVRFAAQAFGIKVIPTYDENGATADILFNL